MAAISDRGISDNLAAVTATINQLTASGKHLESKSLQHKQYIAAEAVLDLVIESANLCSAYLKKNRQPLLQSKNSNVQFVASLCVGVGAQLERISFLLNGKKPFVSYSKLRRSIYNALRSSVALMRAAENLIEKKGPKADQERILATLKELEKAS